MEWNTNHIKRVSMKNYLGEHNDTDFLLTEDNETRGMRFSESIQEK